MRKTALYRLFDADGQLLYIGITYHPSARFTEHRGTQKWWPKVARKEVEWHENRGSATRAERSAIRSESPKWNIVFTDKHVIHNRSQSRVRSVSAPPTSVVQTQARPSGVGFAAEAQAALVDFEAEMRRIDGLNEEAMRRRDLRLREIHQRTGWKQVDLIQATGYTRETIRQTLNPEIRDAIKARRAAKKKEA